MAQIPTFLNFVFLDLLYFPDFFILNDVKSKNILALVLKIKNYVNLFQNFVSEPIQQIRSNSPKFLIHNINLILHRFNWSCYVTFAHHHKNRCHTEALHKRTDFHVKCLLVISYFKKSECVEIV